VSAQRTGLKYFEDFKQRIPRPEVALIEAVVREAAVDVLECHSDSNMLFCCALGRCVVFKDCMRYVQMHSVPVQDMEPCVHAGPWSSMKQHLNLPYYPRSYRRGKPMTGDVDMLIAPPPSCNEVDSRQALHAVCTRLRSQVCPLGLKV